MCRLTKALKSYQIQEVLCIMSMNIKHLLNFFSLGKSQAPEEKRLVIHGVHYSNFVHAVSHQQEQMLTNTIERNLFAIL